MPASSPQLTGPTLTQSLREYGRGIAGGLLFSLPVLYTMEMWWTGFMATPERLLVGMAGTYALLLLYNRFAGLRASASWKEVAIDSVEELGLGIALAAFLLWLLGELQIEMHPSEIGGKVLIEGMAAAIGVSVGTAQLGGDQDEEDQGMGERDDGRTLGSMIGLGLCGAFLVASNVAPTDEVVQIAAESAYSHLLGIAALSIALSALIVYFSNFRGGIEQHERGGIHGAVRGTVVTYAVALTTSIALLWFFGRLEGTSPLFACAQMVVLGLPAALGASAGRLLIQQAS